MSNLTTSQLCNLNGINFCGQKRFFVELFFCCCCSFLLERQTHRDKERQRYRSLVCKFTPQMTATAGAESIWTQEPGAKRFLWLTQAVQHPKALVHPLLLSQALRAMWKLEQQWYKQHPYGIPALVGGGLANWVIMMAFVGFIPAQGRMFVIDSWRQVLSGNHSPQLWPPAMPGVSGGQRK